MHSPYLNNPIPERPRMYRNTTARVIYTLIPVVTLGFLAPVPFVVAAWRDVIKPQVAACYVAAWVMFLALASFTPTQVVNGTTMASNITGFWMLLLMITAATHAALLDSDRMTFGKK